MNLGQDPLAALNISDNKAHVDSGGNSSTSNIPYKAPTLQAHSHQPLRQDDCISDIMSDHHERPWKNQSLHEQQSDVEGGRGIMPNSMEAGLQNIGLQSSKGESSGNNMTEGHAIVNMFGSDSQYVKMGGANGGVGDINNDDDNDNSSLSPSIVSSVLTADEISDKTGFYTVCLVILLGDMSRGVMFPTLWPLVRSLGGTEVTQGYAVAAFSFGRILVSPMFGSWSIQYGYKYTLVFSCSILLFGTILYSQTVNVALPEFLILAQTVMGIGSGTLGVTRAYVAEITPRRNRTTYIAWLTAVQYTGFTVTPFVGSLFSYIFKNEENEIKAGIFYLNAYSAPAYFMTIMSCITLFILLTKFQDRGRFSVGAKNKKKPSDLDEYSSAMVCCGFLTLYDACILGCMLLNIASKGSIATFETMGISFAESHFDMYNSEAGVIVASCGSLGVFALLSMGHLSKRLSDVQMIVYGMVVMGIGIISLSFLEEDVDNATWRYMFAIFLVYGVGYPIGHTAVMGIFSKIVGRRPQGTLLGWFASAGSLARMTFPIMSGYITHYTAFDILFIILAVVLGIAIAFTTISKNVLTKLSS